MKMIMFFFVLTFCVTFSTLVSAEYSFFGNFQTRGKNELYRNVIREKDLLSMPSWAPEDGETPLSLKKAVEIAKNYARIYQPEFENSFVSFVKLHHFISPYYFKDKWGYFITLQRAVNQAVTTSERQSGQDDLPMKTEILVLMDGSVPEYEVVKK